MRFVVHGCAAAIAVVSGFFMFSTEAMAGAVVDWGLVFMAVSVLLWMGTAVSWVRRHGFHFRARVLDYAVLLGLTALVIGFRAPGFNIMFDEPVLASVAQALVEDQKAGFVVQGSLVGDRFQIDEVEAGKRPLLFPALVAAAHALTGYRVGNAFWVNGLLTVFCLGAMAVVGRRLGGSRAAGWMAAALLASAPVFSESSTGGGLAVLNIAMILVVAWCSLQWLDLGSPESLALLVMSTVLLAHARYESGLFVVSTAVVILVGWSRQRRVTLPWSTVPAPILLLPLAWAHRAHAAGGNLQLERDFVVPTEVFALHRVPDNAAHALRFLFDLGTTIPNSPLLSVLGIVALAALAVRTVRAGRQWSNETLVLWAVAGPVVVNVVMLMAYYWAHWDETVVSRLTLPLLVLLSLAVPMWLGRPLRRRAVATAVAVGAVAYLGLYTVPANAGGSNLAGYRERAEIRTMLEVLSEVDGGARSNEPRWPGAGCDVITTSPQAAMLFGFPSYSFKRLSTDRSWFLESLFAHRPILVFQVGRRFPVDRASMILPTHLLPTGTPVEPLAEYPLIDDCFVLVGRIDLAD